MNRRDFITMAMWTQRGLRRHGETSRLNSSGVSAGWQLAISCFVHWRSARPSPASLPGASTYPRKAVSCMQASEILFAFGNRNGIGCTPHTDQC